jgi:hypothetical protein
MAWQCIGFDGSGPRSISISRQRTNSTKLPLPFAASSVTIGVCLTIERDTHGTR